MTVHEAIKHVEDGGIVTLKVGHVQRMLYKEGGYYYAQSPQGFLACKELSVALGVLLYGKPQRIDIGKIKHEFELMT